LRDDDEKSVGPGGAHAAASREAMAGAEDGDCPCDAYGAGKR